LTKLDLKRELRRLYFPPSAQPVLVDVPEMAFLMIDGRGDPHTTPDYREAVEALFSVSFALKFMTKRCDPEDDYTVMPLEALWWSEHAGSFDPVHRTSWNWTALIAQPPMITGPMVERAVAEAGAKRELPAVRRMRFDRFREGLCAQVMHIGPYEEEERTIEKLHAFIAEHDYPIRGRRHEIYLSDPRRTAPERIRTVIRQPVGM